MWRAPRAWPAGAGAPAGHPASRGRIGPDHVVPPWSVHPAMPDPTARPPSPREQQVALLVAAGLSDAEIARRLGLKPGYVGVCIQRIQRRLDLSSHAEVAAWVTARAGPVGKPHHQPLDLLVAQQWRRSY